MTFHDTRDKVKEQFNLNTIVAIVGFLSIFATIIATWTSVQYRQDAVERWQREHEELHASIKADSAAARTAVNIRLDGIASDVAKLNAKLENMEYRMTTAEKSLDNSDVRTSRVVESYGNQFTEIRAQLASLGTQVALANDSLKRLESFDRLPPELKRN